MSRKFTRTKEDFICEVCGTKVIGTGYTNHCPKCLYSKHVDINPGDRSETCRGLMPAVKISYKTSAGIYGSKILHRCKKCGFERWNSVSENDDKEAIINLLQHTF